MVEDYEDDDFEDVQEVEDEAQQAAEPSPRAPEETPLAPAEPPQVQEPPAEVFHDATDSLPPPRKKTPSERSVSRGGSASQRRAIATPPRGGTSSREGSAAGSQRPLAPTPGPAAESIVRDGAVGPGNAGVSAASGISSAIFFVASWLNQLRRAAARIMMACKMVGALSAT